MGAGGGGGRGAQAAQCPSLRLEGVYGDVQRVKILFNKKENALVQMADGSQAQLGEAAGPAGGGGGPGPGHLGSHASCLPSHEPPQRAQAAREAGAHHAVQAPERAAAPRGPRGPGPHQGLWQLPPAPLQEARLQELPEHLPALGHPAPLQHPVCAWGGGRRGSFLDPRGLCSRRGSCQGSLSKLLQPTRELLACAGLRRARYVSFLGPSQALGTARPSLSSSSSVQPPSPHRPSVSEDDLKVLFSSNGGIVKGFKFFQ